MKTPMNRGGMPPSVSIASLEATASCSRILVFHITEVTIRNHGGCLRQYFDFWRELAISFGFCWTYCVNLSYVPNEDLPKISPKFSYIKNPNEVIKDFTVVVLSMEGATELNTFEHPRDNVAYITGADERTASSYMPRVIPDHKVCITTHRFTKRIERYPLWSVTAMGLCLYDRALKISSSFKRRG